MSEMNDSPNNHSAFPVPGDEARLHREATVLYKEGDLNAAIEKLKAAKTLIMESSTGYPNDTWCRLAKFLAYAGRLDEAADEFDFLVADLDRRARKAFYFGDDNVQFGGDKKILMRDFKKAHKKLILEARSHIFGPPPKPVKKIK